MSCSQHDESPAPIVPVPVPLPTNLRRRQSCRQDGDGDGMTRQCRNRPRRTSSLSSSLWLAATVVACSSICAIATTVPKVVTTTTTTTTATTASSHYSTSKVDAHVRGLHSASFDHDHWDPTKYSVEYFDDPELNWMVRLNGEHAYHGNAVVHSPFDDETLYMTTHSGKLLAMSTINGSVLAAVAPTPKSTTNDGATQQWTMYSESGISFGQNADGGKFLVYSVIHEPPEDTSSSFLLNPKTCVVAVSIPNHEIIWTSSELPGTPNGSPVVYTNQYANENYILLTHNSILLKSDNSTVIAGHVTLLHTERGRVSWTDSEWSREDIPKGYGPPGHVSNPLRGKYDGGTKNSNDLVVWASSAMEGRGPLGNTFAFQLPNNFEETTQQTNALETLVLKKVRWSSITRPVFSSDGLNMFFGVTGNELRGWIGDTRYDETADWSANVVTTSDTSVEDAEAAIPSTPILSIDETRLFAASSATDVACIDTRTGASIWGLKGKSTFLSEPRVSPDDERVYFIQSIDGRIFCHDQVSGKLLWWGSCDRFEEDCANSVRADFTLSPSGQYMYYADVLGRVISLKLGRVVEVKDATRDSDDGPSPTIGVDWPTDPTSNKSSGTGFRRGPSLGGSIVMIVLALLIATASVAYILLVNTYKSLPHPRQEPIPRDNLPDDMNDLVISTDPYDGPDPYEDSLISQHPVSPMSDDEGFEYTYFPWQASDQGSAGGTIKTFEDSFDNISYAPADRLSLLFGTSNRIAPIQEDFSYGAAVFV